MGAASAPCASPFRRSLRRTGEARAVTPHGTERSQLRSVDEFVFVVVVEGHAVLLGERGVLVIVFFIIFIRRLTITESEIKRSRTRLLEFSRLFETAMPTLLHDRAPTL